MNTSRRVSQGVRVSVEGAANANEVKAELRQLGVPNGWLHLLYSLPYVLSYFACAAIILWTDSLWIKCATGVLMGNQLYLLFILHHDCVHFSACKSRRVNNLLGRFYALFLVKTFTATVETHQRHHAYLGQPDKDPDDHFFCRGIRWVWVRYWQNFSWHTYLSLTRYGSHVRNTVLAEQFANIAFWAVIHVVLWQFGHLRDALFVFWIPAATIIFVIGPVTRAYEHFPLTHFSAADPRRFDISYNTVTVRSRWLALLWANITYHVEHHSYPRIPFYRLVRAYNLLRHNADKPYVIAPFTLYGVFQGEAVVGRLRAEGPAGPVSTWRARHPAAQQ